MPVEVQLLEPSDLAPRDELVELEFPRLLDRVPARVPAGADRDVLDRVVDPRVHDPHAAQAVGVVERVGEHRLEIALIDGHEDLRQLVVDEDRLARPRSSPRRRWAWASRQGMTPPQRQSRSHSVHEGFRVDDFQTCTASNSLRSC
jgi:hypothetical protein